MDLGTQTTRNIEQFCFTSAASATHYQGVYDGAASVGIAHNKGDVVPGSLVALDVDVRVQTGVAPTTTNLLGLQLHTQKSALNPNVMYVIPALSLLSETFPFSIASNKTHQGQGNGMQMPPRNATHAPNYIYTAKDTVPRSFPSTPRAQVDRRSSPRSCSKKLPPAFPSCRALCLLSCARTLVAMWRITAAVPYP